MASKIVSKPFIRAHCGAAMEIKRETKMKLACFVIRIFVANSTMNVRHSSNRAANSKAFEILAYSHAAIVIVTWNFTTASNEPIHSFPTKLATHILTFCGRNAFEKNIRFVAAKNGKKRNNFLTICFSLISSFNFILIFRVNNKCLVYMVNDQQIPVWQWFENKSY